MSFKSSSIGFLVGGFMAAVSMSSGMASETPSIGASAMLRLNQSDKQLGPVEKLARDAIFKTQRTILNSLDGTLNPSGKGVYDVHTVSNPDGIINIKFGLNDEARADNQVEPYTGDLDIQVVNGEVFVKGHLTVNRENDVGENSRMTMNIPDWVKADDIQNGALKNGVDFIAEYEGPVKLNPQDALGNIIGGLNKDLMEANALSVSKAIDKNLIVARPEVLALAGK